MEFGEALRDLSGAGTPFVVIGGLLRPLYAPSNPRPTFDLDIVLEGERGEALVRHLYGCRYRLLSRFEAKPWAEPVIEIVDDVEAAVAIAAARPAISFFRESPYALVDVWLDVGLSFADLFGRSRRLTMFGVDVRVVGAADWRRLKELANREKDRADLDAFQEPP
jgi:hypothetical protein